MITPRRRRHALIPSIRYVHRTLGPLSKLYRLLNRSMTSIPPYDRYQTISRIEIQIEPPPTGTAKYHPDSKK